MSEDDFEAEFAAAETGVIAVVERFGRNHAEDGDFFHDWTTPDGSRAVCFGISSRSKFRTPRLIPSLIKFLQSLPQSDSISMKRDQLTDSIHVRREGVLADESSARTMKASGLHSAPGD